MARTFVTLVSGQKLAGEQLVEGPDTVIYETHQIGGANGQLTSVLTLHPVSTEPGMVVRVVGGTLPRNPVGDIPLDVSWQAIPTSSTGIVGPTVNVAIESFSFFNNTDTDILLTVTNEAATVFLLNRTIFARTQWHIPYGLTRVVGLRWTAGASGVFGGVRGFY